jgi:hypothetical protein
MNQIGTRYKTTAMHKVLKQEKKRREKIRVFTISKLLH